MKTWKTGRLALAVCALGVLHAVAGLGAGGEVARAGEVITLTFPYGSEKKLWINDVTSDFNEEAHKTRAGKTIVVNPIPMGSGTMTRELLAGRRKSHLVSPASSIFIEIANDRYPTDTPLIGPTRSLVRSPVVIAMWKPMARALGWGHHPIGWQEVLEMVNNDEGWAKYDFPEWGRFKFGHTHPEASNSGIIALMAQVYAATGKTEGLTVEDVRNPKTATFLKQIGKGVVHYGSSTGFFGRKMFRGGPKFIAAAVLYENMVIESYKRDPKTELPIVAIYPKEGTFWSDHPVGIVQADWVDEEHKEAAEIYIQYLLAQPRQEKALAFGFRPGDKTIPLGAPIDEAHGVDPTEPMKTLAVPTTAVIETALDVWRHEKKPARLAVALDISGSMIKDERMEKARDALKGLIKSLGEEDRMSLLTFGEFTQWQHRDLSMKTDRQQLLKTVDDLAPFGKTSLYDAIWKSYDSLLRTQDPNTIEALVVISDGADTSSKLAYEELMGKIQFDPDKQPIMIFTVGYGQEADNAKLEQISHKTQAKFYSGDPRTIRKVLVDNAAFFSARTVEEDADAASAQTPAQPATAHGNASAAPSAPAAAPPGDAPDMKVYETAKNVYLIGTAHTEEQFLKTGKVAHAQTHLFEAPGDRHLVVEIDKKDPAFAKALLAAYRKNPVTGKPAPAAAMPKSKAAKPAPAAKAKAASGDKAARVSSEKGLHVYMDAKHVYLIGSDATLETFKTTGKIPHAVTHFGEGPRGRALVVEIDKKNRAFAAELIERYRAQAKAKAAGTSPPRRSSADPGPATQVVSRPGFHVFEDGKNVYVIGTDHALKDFKARGKLAHAKTFLFEAGDKHLVVEIDKADPAFAEKLINEWKKK